MLREWQRAQAAQGLVVDNLECAAHLGKDDKRELVACNHNQLPSQAVQLAQHYCLQRIYIPGWRRSANDHVRASSPLPLLSMHRAATQTALQLDCLSEASADLVVLLMVVQSAILP